MGRGGKGEGSFRQGWVMGNGNGMVGKREKNMQDWVGTGRDKMCRVGKGERKGRIGMKKCDELGWEKRKTGMVWENGNVLDWRVAYDRFGDN